jgi:membrane associated rhomboid family serine protease
MRRFIDRMPRKGALATAAFWFLFAFAFVAVRPTDSWPWFAALYAALGLVALAVASSTRRA